MIHHSHMKAEGVMKGGVSETGSDFSKILAGDIVGFSARNVLTTERSTFDDVCKLFTQSTLFIR